MNCSMWIGIQCESPLCVVKFNSSLIQSKARSIPVPRLLRDFELNTGSLLRGNTDYYYLPFMRGGINPNYAIMLNKYNNDSVLFTKIVYNGYLPYFNWTYPTNATKPVTAVADYLSRSDMSNPVEIIEGN